MNRRDLSVCEFIKSIEQPEGGYLNISNFKVTQYEDNKVLANDENLPSAIVGVVVDNLTRFIITQDIYKSFNTSVEGANKINRLKDVDILIEGINGLDNISVINACKLAVYHNVIFSNSVDCVAEETYIPNAKTIRNIKIMVRRTIRFLKKKGGVKTNVNIIGGFTDIVSSGSLDFIAGETLWDLKVSKYIPTQSNTLQILIYHVLYKRSVKRKYLRGIGIFNPRLNCSYRYDMNTITLRLYNAINDLITTGVFLSSDKKTVNNNSVILPQVIKEQISIDF